MQKFLVSSPHTIEDCKHIVKETLSIGYLTHYYWGCKSGEHCGWVIIDADNEKEALLSVPPLVRHKSKAVAIVQFDPREVNEW
ncbi:MAG: hypothetical protein HY088_08745 [Ignavibacteriales bacterium]|nr:hypothetical protein [Ignavibacteriales bacterium]